MANILIPQQSWAIKALQLPEQIVQQIPRSMKLSVLALFCSAGIAWSAESYAQEAKVSLHANNETVESVLKSIENQSEFSFFYNVHHVDLDRRVSLSADQSDVFYVLGQLFEGTDVTYKVLDRKIILTKADVKEKAPQQNGRTVTGKVVDKNGEPIIGANVVVKGTTNGTITDIDGNFSLNAAQGETIEVSYIGYINQEVKLANQKSLQIRLNEDTQKLDEVVVVGYGTQIKRNITGSVQSVSSDDMADLPVGQMTQKLQGKFAGVQINQTTGKLGEGMSVRVRGQASLAGGTTPLYVVDGMPLVGNITHINPDEIESISVLKDASASSLYGSRAANGVVLIQTKQGGTGKQLSFDAYAGVQFVPQARRPDMMNAQEFAQFQKERAEENGLPVDPAYQNPESLGEGTDWYDVIFRPAAIQNYSLSYSNGSKDFKTSTVLGYYKQDGVLRNSFYQRFTARANSEYNFRDIVRVGVNVAPTYINGNQPVSDGEWWLSKGIIQGALLTSPLCPYINEDGSIPLTASGAGMFENPNWYNVLQLNEDKFHTLRMIANAFLEVQPIKDLKIKTSVNGDATYNKANTLRPSKSGETYNAPYLIPSTTENSYSNYSWLWENTATYSKTINDHSFDVLVGFSAQEFHNESTYIEGRNYPDDKITTLNAAETITANSNIEEWALLSYIGRLNYNYKGRYLLSAAIRRDGSSRFGALNRWGNFPSVSVGWVVSDEEFLKPIQDKLSFLKVRASYGLVGNDQIGNYAHLANIGTINYSFNNALAAGRGATSMGNPMLGWERNKQFDFGIDMSFFNNRISFMYDYYNKRTDALLYSLEVPISSGFWNIQSNAGELKFWGHEFTLSTKNLTGEFQWTTDFNLTYNDNKCLSLGKDNAPIIGQNITQVGERIGQFYGLVWEGLYNNQEEFDKYPKHTNATVGTVRYKDSNGDGVVTQADDREVIGNPVPLWLLGMTNNFSYKNFDLSIVMSGGFGYQLANMNDTSAGNLDGVFNVYKAVANRWKSPEDPGDGRYGTTKIGTTGPERDWFSSRFLYDASYLTIKNITLGYTVPLKSTEVIKRLRAYLSFQNVYTFTGYVGPNPEASQDKAGNASGTLYQGFDYTSHPIPRTVTVGFNISF